MALPKFIPKPVFQAIGITSLIGAMGVVGYWGVTFTGPYAFFAQLLADGRGNYDVVAALALTFLATLMPVLAIVLPLRAVSHMPTIGEEISKIGDDPVLGAIFGKKDVEDKPFEGQLAGKGARVIAVIIDRGIAVFIAGLVVGVGIALKENFGGPAEIIGIALAIAGALGAALYSYQRDAIGGRSIARRMLGQQVVDIETREPIGPWRAFKRDVTLHLGPVLVIELFMMFTREDGRRLGDLWANSIVVEYEESDVMTGATPRSEVEGPWGHG